MSSTDSDAAAAAAAAALHQFVVEDWTLFSIGISFTMLRTFARVKYSGWKGLGADDYLVWVAMIFYIAETTLAYSVGAVAQGLANNGMTDAERMALDPNSHEFSLRVTGSQIQLAGWSNYSALLWSLKLSLLALYLRLTAGLERSYTIRIYAGFAFVITSWLSAMLVLLLSCRPFYRNWQINPNPGNVCQPAISNRVVWVYCVMNIITDAYLLSIPLPMLWNSSLKRWKKIGLILLFSGGIFVMACGLLRAALIVADPVNGAQLAGSWAVRETFVATITTNLPIVFPFVVHNVSPWVGSLVRSVRGGGGASGKTRGSSSDGTPRNFVTIGGGGNGGNKPSWRGRGPRTPNPITQFTLDNESEERMLAGGGAGGQVRLQTIPSSSSSSKHAGGDHGDDDEDAARRDGAKSAIRKEVEVAVTSVPGADAGDGWSHSSQGHYAFARGPDGSPT
ncbi:hypothetical protein F4780DRAFT_33261 [Xylariomycetidae sp. FL0641]|nr:hypothetical protein F4780DRAFT_33261 [Xylariomycetidae sp. FL0641]